MLHVFFFWKCDLILFITFQKKSNHLKKTKFGQGLIPQTLIQRFGMLKDPSIKVRVQLGSQGIASLLFSQSLMLHVGMCLNILACQFSPLFNMIPIERVSTLFCFKKDTLLFNLGVNCVITLVHDKKAISKDKGSPTTNFICMLHVGWRFMNWCRQ